MKIIRWIPLVILMALALVSGLALLDYSLIPNNPHFGHESVIAQIDRVAAGEIDGINIVDTKSTDELIDQIVARAPNVKSIALSGTDITDKGIERLGDLKELIDLEIDNQVGLSPRSFEHLRELPKFEGVIYNAGDEIVEERLRELDLLK
jgi:hypothetical protein